MVVVSPFVAGQKEGNNQVLNQGISIIQSLSDVTYIQNQTAMRGTSLAGGALVAYGSKPRHSGYISYLHKPTSADVKLKTGKGFQPHTKHGLKFTKPYSGIGRSGVSGPATPRHGHYTQDHRSKRGVTQPARTRSPRAVALGRALPVLGYSLVGINLYNSYLRGDDPNATTRKALGLPPVYSFDAPVLGSEKLGFVTSPNFIMMSVKALYPGGLF